MGYELKVDGMAEISETLAKLEERAPAVAAKALYEGAGIMADEVKKGADSIRTAPFKWASNSAGETRLPSPEEKEIVLQASAGIAKFDKTGTEVNTSVGYKSAGYAVIKGKTKPVPLIVNAINSGTSFMHKQPFVRQAARSGGAKAMSVMTAFIEDAFGKITK
jgi:hypothetical protein